MCDDKYTYSQLMTIGGLGTISGTSYIVESPFSGDEYEYQVLGVTSGDAAGQYLAFLSADQDIANIPFDGSIAFGSRSSAPYNFLKGQPFRLGPTSSIPPSQSWVRVANGNKYLFAHIFTPAASALFVTVQFRFLPVRVIPAKTLTVPDTAEEQHNILRADKVIERLELDIERGENERYAGYGKLR